MIIAQWTCEVPPANQRSLLRFATTEMRSIYRSHGCLRNEIYVPVQSTKKYFPFHGNLKATQVVEQLAFPDLKTFESFLESMAKDPTASAATDRYMGEFGVFNCTFTVLSDE